VGNQPPRIFMKGIFKMDMPIIPCTEKEQREFYAIKQGVYEAMQNVLPSKDEILYAITEGVENGLPISSSICEAIESGVGGAMPHYKDVLNRISEAHSQK